LPPEPTILAFDTSAAHCAAALLRGGAIVAARHEAMARGQAERLMPLLEELLEEAGCDWAALDALGVGVGPGNFTGIRISVALARGLALGLGRPAIGVSGFEVLAHGREGGGGGSGETLAIPAPRGMAYLLTKGAAPELGPAPEGAITEPLAPAAETIARIAAARLAEGGPFARPAPLYLRPADAAPPADAPPEIVP